MYLRVQYLQRRSEEPPGAAGKISNRLAQLGLDHLHHKICHCPGRIEFTGIARALQTAEDRLIDFPEGVPILIFLKVDFVNGVDNLSEQDTVLHVVIVVLKSGADNDLAHWCILIDFNAFEGREQLDVYKVEQRIASEGLAVLMIDRPVAPA